MRLTVLATLTAIGMGLAGVSTVAAAPASGTAIDLAVKTLPQADTAQYWRYRRHYWRPRYYRYRYWRRW